MLNNKWDCVNVFPQALRFTINGKAALFLRLLLWWSVLPTEVDQFSFTHLGVYTSADVSSTGKNSGTHPCINKCRRFFNRKYFFCGTSTHIDYGFTEPRSNTLCFYAVCIILLSHKDGESSVHSLLVIHFPDRHQSRFSQNEANMGAEFWEKLVCVSDSWSS